MLLEHIIDTFVKKKPVAIEKSEQIDDKPLKAKVLTGKQPAQTLALDPVKTKKVGSDKISSDSSKEAINNDSTIGQNHFNFKYASKPYNKPQDNSLEIKDSYNLQKIVFICIFIIASVLMYYQYN
jgi:hypothetical protein